jgi:hypothetical protein
MSSECHPQRPSRGRYIDPYERRRPHRAAMRSGSATIKGGTGETICPFLKAVMVSSPTFPAPTYIDPSTAAPGSNAIRFCHDQRRNRRNHLPVLGGGYGVIPSLPGADIYRPVRASTAAPGSNAIWFCHNQRRNRRNHLPVLGGGYGVIPNLPGADIYRPVRASTGRTGQQCDPVLPQSKAESEKPSARSWRRFLEAVMVPGRAASRIHLRIGPTKDI